MRYTNRRILYFTLLYMQFEQSFRKWRTSQVTTIQLPCKRGTISETLQDSVVVTTDRLTGSDI